MDMHSSVAHGQARARHCLIGAFAAGIAHRSNVSIGSLQLFRMSAATAHVDPGPV
jgi:hypothetical protein